MIWFKGSNRTSNDPDLDTTLSEALRTIDPAHTDPNYWFRFHGSVMAGAGRELARRRRSRTMTVGDVLVSWARTIVPTAAIAAAAAAFVLLRPAPTTSDVPVGVEELLVVDLPAETAPLVLSRDGSAAMAMFSSENF